MNARGEFVVAWVNVPVDGTEPRTIVARRFAADGMPVTEEIQVAEFPADDQPAEVVIREDGSFFVVFPVFPDLVARRYGPDGGFEGESVVARRLLRGSYAVAARPDGGFALVWMRQTGEQLALVARIIGADGQPAGPERRLGQGDHPAVAAGPDGGFVAAWVGEQATGDPHFFDLYILAQRFDASGKPLGGRIAVQGRFHGVIGGLSVARDEAGNFFVLWRAEGELRPAGARPRTEQGIYGRRFDADGAPLTEVLEVAGFGAQGSRLAMDRAGNFVVAWASATGASPGVFARRFTAGGTPFGPVLQVDTLGSAGPLVASDANGNFVVVWSGIGREILAQRYRKR